MKELIGPMRGKSLFQKQLREMLLKCGGKETVEISDGLRKATIVYEGRTFVFVSKAASDD